MTPDYRTKWQLNYFIHKLIVKRNISTFFTLGLIRSISTVIFIVTLEFLWDTFPIPAGEFPCFTCSYNERKKKEKKNWKSYFFQFIWNWFLTAFLDNSPQFSSSVLSPQSSEPSHLQKFGLQRPFLHFIWNWSQSEKMQTNKHGP